MRPLEGDRDRNGQPAQPILADEVARSGLDQFDRGFIFEHPGDDYDRQVRAYCARNLDCSSCIETREPVVAQHDVGLEFD